MSICELKNVLTKKVISVTQEISVFNVILIMVENGISSIVITDDKKPVGIFTERDVMRLAKRSAEFSKIKINEVMSKPVLTVDINSDILEVYGIYKRNRIRHIVVLDLNGNIAGLVSSTDIVNNLGLEFYLEFKSVLQIMERKVLTIEKGLTVMDAVSKMKANMVSCIVIEEGLRPLGILTERDIIRILRDGHDLNTLIINEVMSQPVYSVESTASVYDAAEILKSRRIRRLVIVDHNGMTCGVITQSDIIRGLETKYLDFLVNMLREKEVKLKESQKELREKTVFFDNIMCTSKDVAIIGADTDLKIKYYNPIAENIFKTKLEDVKGRTLIDLYRDNKLDESPLQEAKTAIQNNSDYDYCMSQEIDGKKRYIKIKMFGVWSSEGELLGIALMAYDTTELVMTSEQMTKLANAVEQSPDCVVIANMNGIIEYVNPAFVKLTGYSREDAIGKTPKILQSGKHNKYFYKKLWKTILAGQTFSGVFVDKKKNGDLFYEEKAITPISISIAEKKHTHFVSTGRDITINRKLEDELHKAKRFESIGVLAGGLAHDFNNILTTILGNTNLAMLLLNPQDKVYKNLSDVEKATMRARDLAQQLLTFTKGGLPVREAAPIDELITGTVEFALKGSNVISEFIIAKDLYPVEIDTGQIHQVLNNLVINAMQAMPDGGGFKVVCQNIDEDEASKIESLEKRKYIKISFKDHGTGIEKEDLAKIFNPYFTTKESGSGLGLASSFSIIKNHGGLIKVESELGKGTTFYIYLPASVKKVVIVDNNENISIKGKGKVLLMDDEKPVRDLTSEILQYVGFEVEVVKDGKEAIEVYKNAMKTDVIIDAVIMDSTIPGGMGGKETIAELLQVDPDANVIIADGNANDPVVENYKDYGFSGVIKKPFKVNELNRALNKVMSTKEPQPQ